MPGALHEDRVPVKKKTNTNSTSSVVPETIALHVAVSH